MEHGRQEGKKKNKPGPPAWVLDFLFVIFPSGWPYQLQGTAIFLEPGNLRFRAADARGQAGRKESGRSPATPSAGQGTGTHRLRACFLLVAKHSSVDSLVQR